MIRMVIIFVILLGSLFIGTWLHHETGYVLISVHHWTIESSVWVAFAAFLLFAFALHLLLEICKYLSDLPHRWHAWRAQNRLVKAQKKTRRGLIEFSEGHWKTAKKYLIAGAPNTDLPLVNYLTAARAAEELGDHGLRNHYLHQAREAVPDATIAIEITQAELQLRHKQWKEAGATLQALQIITPDHPYVLKLLLQLHQSTENWAELVKLLPKIKSNKMISDKEIWLIKQQSHRYLLRTYIHQHDHAALESFMQNLPRDFKNDSEIVGLYIEYLLTQGQDKKAEELLRLALQSDLNEGFISLYSKINPESANIPFVEQLLQKHPDSAILHFCLGQLLIGKQLWGTAKAHLEKSIQIKPTLDAGYALGKLLEILNDQNSACRIYRLALESKENL